MRSFPRRFPVLGGLQLIALLCAALATVATATVKGAPPPTLGNYPHPVISLSANTTVLPDAAPTNTAVTIVTASTNRSSLATPIPTPTPTPPPLIVTNLNDSGPGSLRQLLAGAHDGDRIQFDPALNGQAITLTSGQLVVNKNIAISGPGASLLTIRRDPQSPTFRVFWVLFGAATVIEGITITGGYEIVGGGIWNTGTLTITDSIVTGNSVGRAIPAPSVTPTPFGFGGGIFSEGLLTIRRSTISNNTAAGNPDCEGGGIDGGRVVITESTISHNHADGNGGGIHSETASFPGGPTTAIIDSTVDDNTAGADGGGIYGWGLSLQNSTVSNNQSAHGPGIFTTHYFLDDPYPVTITNSTLSGNSSTFFESSILNANALQIGNTIIQSGGTSVTITNDGGTITSLGYNLSSDNGGGFLTGPGDQINTDAILGPLRNNGGPTFTHNLLSGSPAINAGDPSFTPPPLYDQRGPGYARVFNGRIDIGSLEVQPVPTPTPTPTPAAQTVNLSTRMLVQTGDSGGIGGFIITGSAPKRVIIRAIGPSLAQFGVPNPLADTVLELHGPAGFVTVTNDNWRSTQEAEIIATGLAPTDNLEAAIVANLAPGNYTAIVQGKNNTTGLALVEVYDLDPAAASKLANISTRAFVGTGTDVMIGGFILGGGADTQVVIRGLGPSLAAFGISPVLADPTLEFRDSNGVLLGPINNCEASLLPPDPLEACIEISLPPGASTAILAGKNGGTGIGLLEIYNLN